ncbi:MAG: alpha/beta fold hydrolase [Clostridia bacterium]|nr:alpha/beta fold hydrolase [Clostridia bacterium]
MKKFTALFLIFTLMFSLAAPCLAVVEPIENIPVITIRGDGNDIYDASGKNIVWPVSFGDDEGDNDQLVDSIIDVIFPHLVTGLLTGNYEGYYEAFYKAILPLFDEALLDSNGSPSNGTQVDPQAKATNIEEIQYKYDKKSWHPDGFYAVGDYTFAYDWRLSPLETVIEFDKYVQDVMRITGAKKVNIHGICLGGTVVTTYLDMYLKKLENGSEPYIKNVMFDASVANDCLVFTDAFRGKIDLDPDGLQRFLDEFADPDENTFGALGETLPFLNELIFSTYDLLRETDVAGLVFDEFEKFYEVIYEGLVPKLAIASYATFPGYWASVDPDYYEDAKAFVFADPAMREEYAGLIKKLDAYYTQISSRSEEILLSAQEKGVHIGIIAKYGTHTMPFIERQDEVCDRLVSVNSTTFGATCSTTRGQLSEDYIAERVALGYGEYISADKKIDLSTATFKDTTWVIKNCSHDHWSHEKGILTSFFRSTGMTTLNDETWARFQVCDGRTNDDNFDGMMYEMTEENPGEDMWEDTPTETENSTIWTKLAALFRWLTAVFKALTYLITH